MTNPEEERIFYIDFDRLLHWLHSYPGELKDVLLEHGDLNYLQVERSPRAFETHPETQKRTETIVNEMGSKILGFQETIDLISVCFLLHGDMVHKLLQTEDHTDVGFYGAWPLLFHGWTSPTNRSHVKTEGLEWETPDRFTEEIEEEGFQSWNQKFQSRKEWKKRVRYLHECLKEMSAVSEFKLNDD